MIPVNGNHLVVSYVQHKRTRMATRLFNELKTSDTIWLDQAPLPAIRIHNLRRGSMIQLICDGLAGVVQPQQKFLMIVYKDYSSVALNYKRISLARRERAGRPTTTSDQSEVMGRWHIVSDKAAAIEQMFWRFQTNFEKETIMYRTIATGSVSPALECRQKTSGTVQ